MAGLMAGPGRSRGNRFAAPCRAPAQLRPCSSPPRCQSGGVEHWAETVARRYLETRGYILLAQNYRTRRGEIDLVMRHGGTLVFVEVRQRRRLDFGSPAESIDGRKRRRLRLAALHYLTHRCRDPERLARFDAVLLTGGRSDYRLEHLEGIAA